MRRHREAQGARRGRVRVWPPVIAASVGTLLTACSSPLARTQGPSAGLAQPQASSGIAVPSPAGAWPIAPARTADVAAFQLVATEPLPTPKTRAAGDPGAAPRAIAVPAAVGSATRLPQTLERPRAIRTVQTRVREAVGAVYFGSAGTRLSAAGLPTVAAAAARTRRADRVVLTAYTDPRGTPGLNRLLADRRAESVATALAARGIEPAQLIVRTRPQCCATQPLSERDAAPYRRVDIEILTHRTDPAEERAHDQQPHS